MDHSNYEQYTLDELYDALDTVDELEYPGQLALIEQRIQELESQNDKQPELIKSDTLTKWVRYFLYLQLLTLLAAFMSGYFQYRFIYDVAGGIYQTPLEVLEQSKQIDLWRYITGLARLIAFILAGFLVLKWIYRSNYNAHQLGAKNMNFSPGWSVGWYFIPIGNLWKPYQAMSEIWRASHYPDNWKEQESDSVLRWWWFLWIISGILGSISSRLARNTLELSSIVSANLAAQASNISLILATLSFLVVVDKIHKAQNKASLNSKDNALDVH